MAPSVVKWARTKPSPMAQLILQELSKTENPSLGMYLTCSHNTLLNFTFNNLLVTCYRLHRW
jgi:hypothetical protein